MSQDNLEKVNNALTEYKNCYEVFLPQRAENPITSIERTAVAKLKARDRFILILKRDVYSLLSSENRKICDNFENIHHLTSLEKVGDVLRNIKHQLTHSMISKNNPPL